MWGAVTNTGYNGMPIFLGIARTQIHCLGPGSVAYKPCMYILMSLRVSSWHYRLLVTITMKATAVNNSCYNFCETQQVNLLAILGYCSRRCEQFSSNYILDEAHQKVWTKLRLPTSSFKILSLYFCVNYSLRLMCFPCFLSLCFSFFLFLCMAVLLFFCVFVFSSLYTL